MGSKLLIYIAINRVIVAFKTPTGSDIIRGLGGGSIGSVEIETLTSI